MNPHRDTFSSFASKPCIPCVLKIDFLAFELSPDSGSSSFEAQIVEFLRSGDEEKSLLASFAFLAWSIQNLLLFSDFVASKFVRLGGISGVLLGILEKEGKLGSTR